MREEMKQIREYIACPQFGDNYYGEWRALRLDQRIKMDLFIYVCLKISGD